MTNTARRPRRSGPPRRRRARSRGALPVNGDGVQSDADVDEVPQDDVVVSLICSAIALTVAGLVALLLVWR